MSAAEAHLRPAVPRLAPPDQGTANRGGSLSGRHADHARRRRVHHQRCRARRGEPVASQPWGRLRQRIGGRRPPHVQLPRDSRARQLDRAEHQQERHAQRAHRPERQVLGDDVVAGHGSEIQPQLRPDPRVLRFHDRENRGWPQRGQNRGQAGGRRHRVSGQQRQGRRSHRRGGAASHEEHRRADLHVRPDVGRGHGRSQGAVDLQ